MFFFECSKVIADEGEYLVYSKNNLFVQCIDEDNVMITEYVVPNLFSDEKEDFEVSIYLDEKIIKFLKLYKLAKVEGKNISFDDNEVVYTYDKSSEDFLETQFSEKCCLLTLPKIHEDIFDDSEKITLTFSRCLFIKNDIGVHLKFPIQHLFSKCEISVNSNYLTEIFKQNENKSCVIYCEKNLPLCFEFIEPNKKIFLAPLVD